MTKVIIFDLDGVLIDATGWHYEALNQALQVFGFEIKFEDHLNIYNGLPTTKKLLMMSEKQGLPLGLHPIIKSLKQKYTDEKVNIDCAPDHEKQLMLNNLKKAGYRLACCSNSQKYSVMNMLKRAQIEHFFEQIIGNDEGFNPKPAPDIYLAAFKRLGIKAKEALIIEDAPHGVTSAKASGGKTVIVKGVHDVNLGLFINLGLL